MFPLQINSDSKKSTMLYLEILYCILTFLAIRLPKCILPRTKGNWRQRYSKQSCSYDKGPLPGRHARPLTEKPFQNALKRDWPYDRIGTTRKRRPPPCRSRTDRCSFTSSAPLEMWENTAFSPGTRGGAGPLPSALTAHAT